MPTPDRPDEFDDILFDEGAVDELVHAGAPGSLAFPRLPEAPPSRRVDDGADEIFGDDPVAGDAAAAKPIVDTVDAALFGRAEPSAPTADVQPDLTPPDIAPFEAPFEEDDATVERELAAAPALLPLIVDDVDVDPAFAEGPRARNALTRTRRPSPTAPGGGGGSRWSPPPSSDSLSSPAPRSASWPSPVRTTPVPR
jgi:hypothetical protein